MAQTHLVSEFADGKYRFALGLEQIEEIQTRCKAGIGEVYARVLQGRVAGDMEVGHPAYAMYRHEDLLETIRQGLIGGGEGMVDGQEVKVTALRANELVDRYLLGDAAMPLTDQWKLAAAILFAKVEGYTPPDGEVDKKKETVTTTGEDGSTMQAP